MPEILLRFCEGAAVVLYRDEPGVHAENVPTRVDLFEYAGGYAWGYGGSGPNAVSHAVAPLFSNDSRRSLASAVDTARRTGATLPPPEIYDDESLLGVVT